jgi:hypothetical protein
MTGCGWGMYRPRPGRMTATTTPSAMSTAMASADITRVLMMPPRIAGTVRNRQTRAHCAFSIARSGPTCGSPYRLHRQPRRSLADRGIGPLRCRSIAQPVQEQIARIERALAHEWSWIDEQPRLTPKRQNVPEMGATVGYRLLAIEPVFVEAGNFGCRAEKAQIGHIESGAPPKPAEPVTYRQIRNVRDRQNRERPTDFATNSSF